MAETTGTKKSSGHLAGQIQRNSVPEGTYKIFLKGFTSAKWSQTKADVNDNLTMEVGCEGVENGTKANFRIYERNSNHPDVIIDKAEAQVNGKQISAQWKYPKDRWAKAKPPKRPMLPSYYFECSCLGNSIRSGLLQLTTTINITVLDENNKAVSNEPFDLFLSTKEIRPGTTDGSGKAKFQKIPLGCHQIKFSKNPLIAPDKPTKVESPLEIQKFPLDIFNANTFYANSVVVRCNHKVDSNYRFVINPPFFAVVQDPPKEHVTGTPKELDKVHVYSDTKKALTEKNGEKVARENEAGFSKSAMECGFKGKTDYKMLLNPHFWSDYNKPTEYEIQGLKNKLPIKAYSPDEFSLSIKLPPPKKFDIGKKHIEGEKEYKGEESIIYDKQTKKFVRESHHFEQEPKEGQWGKLKHPLAIGSTDKPISLEVNNKTIEISALDAFASVLLLSKQFGEIIELITKSMPKAGWYCTLGYKILEGKLAFAWKWKEHTDHRVFCNMAASIDMTLFGIEWEIGVGVSAFLCEGQVFFQINGEITLGVEAERASPDNALELKIPFGAKLEGVVGARIKATFMFQVELTASTAFEVSDGAFKVNTEEGVSASANLRWTGFKGKIKVSAGPAKAKGNKEFTGDQATAISSGKESVWVKEVDLKKFEWPAKGEYQQKYLTPEEIKKVFETVFTKNETLVVESQIQNRAMQMDSVIDEIVSHFGEVPRLDRSNRVMEGVALGIKDKLGRLAVSDATAINNILAVKQDSFLRFCQDGQLKSILENAEDQTENLKQDLAR
jgi:hypothetical protein